MSKIISKKYINFILNDISYEEEVDDRILLSDFIRINLGMTGTNIGCEHGICGSCTIHINGRAVRSCLSLAIEIDNCTLKYY